MTFSVLLNSWRIHLLFISPAILKSITFTVEKIGVLFCKTGFGIFLLDMGLVTKLESKERLVIYAGGESGSRKFDELRGCDPW